MNIAINQSDINRINLMFSEIRNAVPKILTTSINKTLGNVKEKQVSEVFSRYTLKKTRIKKDFTIKKANYDKLSGKVVAKGKPVGLIQFSANQTKKGVSAKVLRSGGRKLIKSAFKQKSKGTEHVFKRLGTARHPINRKTGPRIEDALVQPEVMRAVQERANEQWDKNVNAAIDRAISRL